jgi:hypothetical protein
VVDVVDEAHADAPRGGLRERLREDRLRLLAEIEVVLREVEGLLRAVDERRDRARDVRRLLAAVGQGADLDALAQDP